MKARVKNTGEIITVCDIYTPLVYTRLDEDYNQQEEYLEDELEFILPVETDNVDVAAAINSLNYKNGEGNERACAIDAFMAGSKWKEYQLNKNKSEES